MFTSNLPIQDLAERIGDRTASRIVEMCEVFELVGSDRRIKDQKRTKIII
jgi:DNA replication protein DnaC